MDKKREIRISCYGIDILKRGKVSMALIEERMQGECKIKVSNDSFVHQDKVQEIINRVSKIVLREEFRLSMIKVQNEMV